MIYILLPAFNEENDLALLLDEFTHAAIKYPYEIIVVDDGSTDNTAAAALKYAKVLQISIHSHKTNMGLGQAINTGLSLISNRLENDDDIVITMDADNTHKPDLVNALVGKIHEGYDIAIASRYADGALVYGVPPIRRILSVLASNLIKVFYPFNGVKDFTSGYRAFSGKAIKTLNNRFHDKIIVERGFSATLELLLKAGSCGLKCAEVPLILRYDQKTGKSKMKVIKTIIQYSRLLFRSFFV